jgi:hypothetical protein
MKTLERWTPLVTRSASTFEGGVGLGLQPGVEVALLGSGVAVVNTISV